MGDSFYSKDYGDYFDDGVDLRKPVKAEPKPEEDENGFLNPFYTDTLDEENKPKKNKTKKGLIAAIIIGIIIILALLGALSLNLLILLGEIFLNNRLSLTMIHLQFLSFQHILDSLCEVVHHSPTRGL